VRARSCGSSSDLPARAEERRRRKHDRDQADGDGEGHAHVEEAAREDGAADERVDAADERGRHLAAVLRRGDAVQLVLGVQERHAVAGADGDRTGEENGQRVEVRRGRKREEAGGKDGEAGRLRRSRLPVAALGDELRGA
jgi:hypothetical protein